MPGIYIHIPFCKKACHYCDFHFSTSLKLKDDLIKSILLEIERNVSYLNSESVETIYFGGGSPSILKAAELDSILDKLFKEFNIESDAEITLEANPDDLSSDKLKDFKSSGINRISVGIQSFRDEDLQLMNRAHDRNMAIKSLERLSKAGFTNLNADLIYGIPGQSLHDWENNLNQFFSFEISHLSAYNLTIEDRTAFGNWVKKGKMKEVIDEVLIDQFEILMSMAKDRGYDHYEISNFCQPGKISKHNTSYWKGEKYLGVGPAAHSFDGKKRRWNIKNNPLYIKAIQNNKPFYEEEILSEKDHFNEYILTSLRTKWGLDLHHIVSRFGKNQLKKLKEESSPYLLRQLLYQSENKLYLTEKGKLVADKITSDLFIV